MATTSGTARPVLRFEPTPGSATLADAWLDRPQSLALTLTW